MAKKDPIGVRFTEDERRALAIAADESSLSLSAMVRMIVVKWLREHGWLKRSGK